MVEQENVSVLLSNAYESLRSVDLAAAMALLDRALGVDYEDPEVLYSLKCANFWSERLAKLSAIQNPFERGESVMGHWKAFLSFSQKLAGDFERARYAFKRFAFSLAHQQYAALPPEEKESHEAELSLKIGRCLKGSGDFDAALKYLESATQARKDDAEVLAELADTRALSGDTRSSKALFREAFYLSAQKIDLDFLESEMLRRLIDRVAGLGYSGGELAEWIPVYGNLLGVFTVKRELKAVEAGKLRQSIYQLENELKENQEARGMLVPRLINRYFWLIDYCMTAKEDRAKIEEILLKIRLLDVSVYKQYIA
jgi:tetratricopeptide (TPR) repeat protein